MYTAVTSTLLKSLSIYKGKTVTLCISGGVHSAALILALKAAGVKKLDLIHFIIGELDNAAYQQDLLAVRNMCELLNEKFTTVKLKLDKAESWMHQGKLNKLNLIAQQAPVVMSADTEYCLIGAGKESHVSLLSLRGYFNLAKGQRKVSLTLPLVAWSKSKTMSALADFADILQYETFPRLINSCTSIHRELLLNGVCSKCGECAECKSLKEAFPFFGFERNLLLKKNFKELESMYRGSQQLKSFVCGDKVVTVAVSETGEYCHTVSVLDKLRELFVSFTPDNTFETGECYVGEWNYSMHHLPEAFLTGELDFKEAKAQSLVTAGALRAACRSILQEMI